MKKPLFAIAAAVYAALSIGAAFRAPGSAAVTLSFLAVYGALLFLVFPKPRLYVYTCTAVFLFLGFAVKFIALQLFEVQLLEPIGAFSHSAIEWDRALLAAAAGAAGLIVVRLVQLRLTRGAVHPQTAVPDFYVRHRAALWISASVAFVVLAVLNLAGSFYQIGVGTQWILPLRLHIIASWLVHSGFILVTALLVAWETSLRQTSAAFAAPAVEGLLISISALSRSLFMLHVLPFALWMIGHDEERPRVRVPRWYTAYAALFVASIAGVMVGRAVVYPHRQVLAPETRTAVNTLPVKPASATPAVPATTQVAVVPAAKAAVPITSETAPRTTEPSPAKPAQVATSTATTSTATTSTAAPSIAATSIAAPSTTAAKRAAPPVTAPPVAAGPVLVNATPRQQMSFAFAEVQRLIIGRWVGLEGAVAVAAHESRSPAMLMKVLREDPAGGRYTTYQRVARATYKHNDGFTFLTLAGLIGVLSFSGSLLIVFAASAGIAILMAAIEMFTIRALRAPIAAGAVGVMVANSICQMNFPYLSLVLAIEQVVAVAAVGIVLRLLARRTANGRDAAIMASAP